MRTHTALGASAAALLVLAAPRAEAQFGQTASELELIKLADDLYVIHNAFVPGNTTVLITDDGVLLVDNKFPIDYPNLSAMLKTVTDKPVKYVVNTHYHDDHSGSNANFQSGGTIAVASEAARGRMLARNQGLPDVTVVDRGNIYLGGKTAQVYWLGRGHTDGDVVVLLPDHNVLVAGDLYANDPGTPELIDYGGGGSAKEWTGTLDKALALPFATVVPGHGKPASKEELKKFRDSTARVTELITQMVRQGRDAAAVEATMRSEFGWQDFHVNMALTGLIDEMRR